MLISRSYLLFQISSIDFFPLIFVIFIQENSYFIFLVYIQKVTLLLQKAKASKGFLEK